MEAGAIPAQGRCCDSRMGGADATGKTGKALRPEAVGLPRDQSEYLPLPSAAVQRRHSALRTSGAKDGQWTIPIVALIPAAVRELFADGVFLLAFVFSLSPRPGAGGGR